MPGRFNMGDRYDWRGKKHGPWRQEKGALARIPTRTLPVRFNSGPTPRDAIFDFVALVEAHPGVLDLI